MSIPQTLGRPEELELVTHTRIGKRKTEEALVERQKKRETTLLQKMFRFFSPNIAGTLSK
jgi:hypothetical protein